ncbi:MAG: ankyrin repeat domain-containing protein, partial [Rickettsia sp.]|nr:ankyrin repeat domain-containing protein [Rickettsia sp.]
MTYRYIIETLKKFDPDFDDGQVNRAINFALKHYGNNNDRSLEIAETIISIYPDTNSIITSLLFFSLAKNHLKATKIKHYFGEEIVGIFDSLTKLFQIQHTHYHNKAQETFKLLLSLNPNIGIRILLIRYAYLLHKIIFTFKVSDIEYYLISKEINEVYVPLFKEIKVEKIKTILQNVCLKILQPKLNKFIITFLEKNYPNQEQLVIKIINAFHDILSGINIAYIISGRVKSPYSIARKIVQKSNETKRLFDIIGIRVIVEQEAECYKILDTIYNNYQHVPERHKDFIKLPKKNNYQSLHTIIIDRDSRKLEVQIRTKRMHYIAQFGTASHLQYKMQSIKSKNLDIAYSILNRFIVDILNQFNISTMVHKSFRIDNRSAYLISDMIGIIKPDKRTLQQDISYYQVNPIYHTDKVKIVRVNQESSKFISIKKPPILIGRGKISQFQDKYLATMQTRYKYKNSQKSNVLEAAKKNLAIILEKFTEESNNAFPIDQSQEIKIVSTASQNTHWSNKKRGLESDTRCRSEHNVSSISISIKSNETPNYISENVLIDQKIQDSRIDSNNQKTNYSSSSPKLQRTVYQSQDEKGKNTSSSTDDDTPNDSKGNNSRNNGSNISNSQDVLSKQERLIQLQDEKLGKEYCNFVKVDEDVNAEFSLAVEEGNIIKVKELLMLRDEHSNYRVNTNKLNNDDYTPLKLALLRDHLDIILLLLDRYDNSVLHMSELEQKQLQEQLSVKFLLKVYEEDFETAQKLLMVMRKHGLYVLNIIGRDEQEIISAIKTLLNIVLLKQEKDNKQDKYDISLGGMQLFSKQDNEFQQLWTSFIKGQKERVMEHIYHAIQLKKSIKKEINQLSTKAIEQLKQQCYIAKLCYAVFTEDINAMKELVINLQDYCPIHKYWSLLRNEHKLLFKSGQKITELLYLDYQKLFKLRDYDIFSYAVTMQDYKVIEELIDAGKDINDVSNEGYYTIFFDAVSKNEIDIIKKLLTFTDKNGHYLVSINYEDQAGISVLLCAVIEGHTEIVKILVALKDNNGGLLVNICHQDEEGNTALSFAAQEGRTEIVKILVALKDNNGDFLVDINHRDEFGKTVMYYFQSNDQMKQLLREHGAKE